MQYAEMLLLVAQSTSRTQVADAFRRAFGVPPLPDAPPRRRRRRNRDRTDYGALMRQRTGALDRGRQP